MLLSLAIIKKYIDIPRRVSPEEIKILLTKSTVEVESIHRERDEVIIEIDNKSLTNRPDLWSHYGIARELAAILHVPLKSPDVYQGAWDNIPREGIAIEIEQIGPCPRYIGAVIKGVTVRESPDWLKRVLTSVGITPINNIVDITNFVLAEIGQPLHAFDAEKIGDPQRIIVRTAKNGETIQTLDGIEHALTRDMLVIANKQKPVALAGIMGGLETGISSETRTIILESANFSAPGIRKTSQNLEVKTESSIRFEKSLHPKLTELGMRRALYLIAQIIPESCLVALQDKNNFIEAEHTLRVSYDFLTRKIGITIPLEQIIEILQDLGFVVSCESENELSVRVPWWRSTGDISIPEDLVEEVVRLYGCDNLHFTEQLVHLHPAKYQIVFEMEARLKNLLSLGCGMNEVFNYPWQDAAISAILGLADPAMEISNPPAPQSAYLQTSLVGNLMKNVRDNSRFFEGYKLFEFTRVFQPGKGKFDGIDELPQQPKMVAGVVVARGDDVLFSAKGIVEQIGKLFNVGIIEFTPDATQSFLQPGASMRLEFDGQELGYLGLIRAELGEALGCRGKQIAFFELNYAALLTGRAFIPPRLFRPIPKYPAALRDISYFVPAGMSADNIQKTIFEAASEKLKKHDFFDIYIKGANKSMSSHLVFQSEETTLTDKEVGAEIENITKALQDKGFVIR